MMCEPPPTYTRAIPSRTRYCAVNTTHGAVSTNPVSRDVCACVPAVIHTHADISHIPRYPAIQVTILRIVIDSRCRCCIVDGSRLDKDASHERK